MLTLFFGRFVSEAMVNRSIDLGLIAKETTMFYGHKFVFTHVLYEGILDRFNEILHKLHLQVTVLEHRCRNGRLDPEIESASLLKKL